MSSKNHDFGQCVYICSKPLQFFHLLAITKHYDIKKPQIYIVTKNFSGWEDFKKHIFRSEFFDVFLEINFLPSYDDVCNSIEKYNYDSLFIEDDRVSLYFVFVKLKSKKMIVFEEGFGTYYSDFPKRLSWIKRVKWISISLIKGCGLNFGGGKCTDHVLTQYPLVYKKLNKLSSFKALEFSGVYEIFSGYNSFWDKLVSDDIASIYDSNPDIKVCLLLATWGGAESEELQKLCESYDMVIYKSHPHDQTFPNLDNIFNLASNWIPAEVYIIKLAQFFNKLDVFHYSSSTGLYLDKSLNNVGFIDLLEDFRFSTVLREKREIYDSI